MGRCATCEALKEQVKYQQELIKRLMDEKYPATAETPPKIEPQGLPEPSETLQDVETFGEV